MLFQQLEQRLRGRGRGGWVLASDQATVRDGEGLPVVHLLEETTEPLELVLDKERHNLCELDFLFLGIGESCNPLALDDWFALVLHVPKHARRVAHRCNRLARVVERLYQ